MPLQPAIMAAELILKYMSVLCLVRSLFASQAPALELLHRLNPELLGLGLGLDGHNNLRTLGYGTLRSLLEDMLAHYPPNFSKVPSLALKDLLPEPLIRARRYEVEYRDGLSIQLIGVSL